jgi:asparagine synthase (glutamine-hydrolysing)
MAQRTKQPYRAPDSNAFFGDLQPAYVRRVLGQPAISASGLFDAAAVAKLVAKAGSGGAAGFRDNTALTGIISTQLWREAFTRGAANSDSSISRQRVA